MYPRFSETFIVNEILELERQGVDVRIYSLRKPDDGRFHASLARVKAGVIYVPQYRRWNRSGSTSPRASLPGFPETYRALRAEIERGKTSFVQAFRTGWRDRRAPAAAPSRCDARALCVKRTRVAAYVHRMIACPIASRPCQGHLSRRSSTRVITHQDATMRALW